MPAHAPDEEVSARSETPTTAGIGAGRYLASSFGFPALIRTDIVVLAIAVSGLVGIAFGFYPAHKASRLDPITALRYE